MALIALALFESNLGKPLKNTIETLTAVLPTLNPAPPFPIFDRLRFFQEGLFFSLIGLLSKA